MAFWADALPPWISAEIARQIRPTIAGLMDMRAPGGTDGDH